MSIAPINIASRGGLDPAMLAAEAQAVLNALSQLAAAGGVLTPQGIRPVSAPAAGAPNDAASSVNAANGAAATSGAAGAASGASAPGAPVDLVSIGSQALQSLLNSQSSTTPQADAQKLAQAIAGLARVGNAGQLVNLSGDSSVWKLLLDAGNQPGATLPGSAGSGAAGDAAGGGAQGGVAGGSAAANAAAASAAQTLEAALQSALPALLQALGHGAQAGSGATEIQISFFSEEAVQLEASSTQVSGGANGSGAGQTASSSFVAAQWAEAQLFSLDLKISPSAGGAGNGVNGAASGGETVTATLTSVTEEFSSTFAATSNSAFNLDSTSALNHAGFASGSAGNGAARLQPLAKLLDLIEPLRAYLSPQGQRTVETLRQALNGGSGSDVAAAHGDGATNESGQAGSGAATGSGASASENANGNENASANGAPRAVSLGAIARDASGLHIELDLADPAQRPALIDALRQSVANDPGSRIAFDPTPGRDDAVTVTIHDGAAGHGNDNQAAHGAADRGGARAGAHGETQAAAQDAGDGSTAARGAAAAQTLAAHAGEARLDALAGPHTANARDASGQSGNNNAAAHAAWPQRLDVMIPVMHAVFRGRGEWKSRATGGSAQPAELDERRMLEYRPIEVLKARVAAGAGAPDMAGSANAAGSASAWGSANAARNLGGAAPGDELPAIDAEPADR